MDLSRGLVTKLVDEGKVKEAIRSGINLEMVDEDSRPVYSYVLKHFGEYKSLPSRDAVLKAFPNYTFSDYKEPVEYFIDALKEAHRRDILEDSLVPIFKTYQKDTKTTEESIRELLGQLSVTGKTHKDVDLAKSSKERLEEYSKRKENPGADGILTNWAKVDYLTLGWHPEEFIVMVGDKYIGKSWLMLWMAYQAMLQGERVLFVTMEMSTRALANRFDSMFAGVQFDSLRRGELTKSEEDRYKKRLDEFQQSNFHFIMARSGVSTIQEIEQKAIEVDATIAFVDSVYLFPANMKTVYHSEVAKRKDISQRCKEAAKSLGIPWVVSTQARRKQTKKTVIDLDEIEYSNAFAQDADAVLFLSKDEIDRELNRIRLDVLKSRDGDIGALYIKTDFSYMKFNEDKTSTAPTVDINIDDESSFEGEETWVTS